MHGRPREPKGTAPDPEKIELAKQKSAALSKLLAAVLSRRAARQYDEASLQLAAKLLQLNPEVYSAWNYRREALQGVLREGGEAAVKAAEAELALTEAGLKRNPKSYSTWHHRRWVVGHRLTPLDRELALVSALLDLDERNFHGWNYRRFAAALADVPPEDELSYTRHKINQNFSNYSAWHYRTSLLPKVHAQQPTLTLSELLAQEKRQKETTQAAAAAAAASSLSGTTAAGGTAAAGAAATGVAGGAGAGGAGLMPLLPPKLLPAWVLDEEFELVQQALWTEPEDQAGWLYHRWLLGAALLRLDAAIGTSQEASAREELRALLSREAAMCRELLSAEPDAKWPLLTLARLLRAQAQWGAAGGGGGTTAGAGAGNNQGQTEGVGKDTEAGRAAEDEARAILERLLALDPMRAGYYRDELSDDARVVMRPARQGAGAAAAVMR